MLIAGKTCDDDSVVDKRFVTVDMQRRMDDQLVSLHQDRGLTPCTEASIFVILSQMQKRKSAKPVDKITGLVCLFDYKHIPIYDAGQSEEDAELVNVAPAWIRGHLFFLYPKPGNSYNSWRP